MVIWSIKIKLNMTQVYKFIHWGKFDIRRRGKIFKKEIKWYWKVKNKPSLASNQFYRLPWGLSSVCASMKESAFETRSNFWQTLKKAPNGLCLCCDQLWNENVPLKSLLLQPNSFSLSTIQNKSQCPLAHGIVLNIYIYLIFQL